MVLRAAVDLKDCVIKFLDGDTPPTELEIKLDEGNLTWSEKRNIEVKKDRGLLDYAKEGDEEPMEVTLECRFSAIISGDGEDVTPSEFLKKEGAASAYLSTSGDCEADTIDIVVEITHDCGTVLDEIITFEKFAYTSIGGDFKAGTLSIQGTCVSVKPSSVRTDMA